MHDPICLALEAVQLGVPESFVARMLVEGLTAHYYIDDEDEDPLGTIPPHSTMKLEVSPPGMKGMVKAMKRAKKRGETNIDNPFALAWWVKNQDYASNYD